MSRTPQTILKTKNKKSILKEVVYRGGISKSELAQRLNSTKTTISKNVNELIKENLLIEIGKGSNTVGKKSTLLDINPDLFHFVIINLSSNEFSLHIYDLAENELFSQKIPIPNKNNIESILESCILKNSSFELTTTILVSIPAVVKENSIVSNNDIYIGIYEKIVDFCNNRNLKLITNNDIDLQAEYLFANYANSKNDNFILIGSNFGIGSSIFYNGKLLKGTNDFAGEISFTNPKVVDGKLENLESRCSLGGIQKKYYAKNKVHLTKEEIIEKIKAKNEFLNNLIDNMIDEISIVITNMTYILDIKNIYLSGLLFELRNDIVQKISDNILLYTNNEANIKYIPLYNKSINGSKLVLKREILKLV